ncbi:HflK protein [Gracilibacillus boraciitolerans JCM 21714]|uniref:HflK protein n=1 Tax=Gracilibacillus boraciitolerans JCM 21714 TaxID=1298598 RepID=W4VIM5_9BACI|nr:HflK protein [Gracilibacillus boraciitolerans JCM 21714]
MYDAYQDSPEITRQRLVLETLDEVLPDANIYIMNDEGNTIKYLPLGQNGTTSMIPPVTNSAEEDENTSKEGGGGNE